MPIVMQFTSEDAGPGEIDAMTQAFAKFARSQPGLSVSRPEDAAPGPGERGGELEIGTLVLALITSGAVTALINILQVQFGRARKLAVTFENPEGEKISVTAENLNESEIVGTTARLKALFGAAE